MNFGNFLKGVCFLRTDPIAELRGGPLFIEGSMNICSGKQSTEGIWICYKKNCAIQKNLDGQHICEKSISMMMSHQQIKMLRNMLFG